MSLERLTVALHKMEKKSIVCIGRCFARYWNEINCPRRKQFFNEIRAELAIIL